MDNENALTKEKNLANTNTQVEFDFEFDFAMCHGPYCSC
jgi:hypothetical protein